jgi:K+ transporter
LKYAILILRADNRGEGGIVALLALLRARHARPGTWRGLILILAVPPSMPFWPTVVLVVQTAASAVRISAERDFDLVFLMMAAR